MTFNGNYRYAIFHACFAVMSSSEQSPGSGKLESIAGHSGCIRTETKVRVYWISDIFASLRPLSLKQTTKMTAYRFWPCLPLGPEPPATSFSLILKVLWHDRGDLLWEQRDLRCIQAFMVRGIQKNAQVYTWVGADRA